MRERGWGRAVDETEDSTGADGAPDTAMATGSDAGSPGEPGPGTA